MEDKICLDTDILIDLLRNKQESVQKIKEEEEKCEIFTTILNIFELYYGAYKTKNAEANTMAVRELCSRISVLGFSLEEAEESGKQKAKLERKGEDLEFRDVIIGLIALKNNCVLMTKNKKHFSRIEGLKVLAEYF
jgi:predicted nucleic acid-binding protein